VFWYVRSAWILTKSPVRSSRDSVGRCADTKGCDFSGVEPCHSEPANCEEGVEDKEEYGLRVVSTLVDLQDVTVSSLNSCI
jgi:hypothetical protein